MKRTLKKRQFLSAVIFVLLLCALIMSTGSMAFASGSNGGGLINVGQGGINQLPDGDVGEIGFTLDTKSAISGVAITDGTVLAGLSFTLKLTKETSLNTQAISFYYTAQDEPIKGDFGTASLDWREIDDSNKSDKEATFRPSSIASGINQSVHKYLYFATTIRVDSQSGTESVVYKYINPSFYDLLINTYHTDAGKIATVSATTTINSENVVYNTQNPTWVYSPITLKVIPVDRQSNSSTFKYTIDGGATFIPLTSMQDEDNQWYAIAVINTPFEGKVDLYSVIGAGTASLGASVFVKIDTRTPQYVLEYNTTDAPAVDKWFSSNVNITIKPNTAPESVCISGVEYSYVEINANGTESSPFVVTPNASNQLTIIVDKSKQIKIRAKSKAGLEAESEPIYINIDKNNPIMKLSIKDRFSTSFDPEVHMYARDLITFTMENTNTAITANLIYEYKLVGNESWIPMNHDGSYNVTFNAPLKNQNYIFRIRSLSGLVSERTVTFSALSSTYELKMETPAIDTNESGWAKDSISVYFNLPDVLNIVDEYEFYSEFVNEPSTNKKLLAEKVSSINGIARYKTVIDYSINSKSLLFYAIDKAGSSSNQVVLREVKLDVVTPDATITKFLKNSEIQLSTTDWANGAVKVVVAPSSTNINFSGVELYRVYSNGLYRDKVVMKNDGTFELEATESVVFSLELVSKAGRVTKYTVDVNIDYSQLSITDGTGGYEFYVAGVAKDKNDIFSQDVDVKFMTSHGEHIRYYYVNYTGSVLPEFDINNYQSLGWSRGIGNLYRVNLQNSSKGTLKYAFYLESLAVDKEGKRYITTAILSEIKYDVVDFSLTVTVDSYDYGWTNQGIEFGLVAIGAVKYQIKLDNTGWIDITLVGQEFVFIGSETSPLKDFIKRTFTANAGKENQATYDLGYAYNGKVSFRGLNQAGHSSSEVELENFVKYDNTKLDPIFAVANLNGSFISDASLNKIYNNENIKIKPINASMGLDAHLAPIKITYNGIEVASETVVNTSDNFVLGISSLANMSEDKRSYKQYVSNKTPKLALSFDQSSGSENSSGVFEYQWKSEAYVEFKTTDSSGFALQYWYKDVTFNNTQEWVKMGTLQSGTSYRHTFTANFNGTLQFRVTDLAGNAVVSDNRLYLKIDNNLPEFQISLTVNNSEIAPDSTAWYNSPINIGIEKTSSNAAKVIFTYAITVLEYDTPSTWEVIPGMNFSTDNLITPYLTEGNGQIYFYIRAKSEASDNYRTSDRMTLKVDKLTPDFDIIGSASGSDLKSGQWVNADSVDLIIKKNNENISGLSFYYSVDNGEEKVFDTLLSMTEMGSVRLRAVTGSNIIIDKVFNVRIDKHAPVIYSGAIKNNDLKPNEPYSYYIDQKITFEEVNLKSATYNQFDLANGKVIATNTVEQGPGKNGYVHIIVEDMAGNKTELKFYMKPFEYNVNTINTSVEHAKLLNRYEADFNNAVTSGQLTDESRKQHFNSEITRLKQRIGTLYEQIADYQAFLSKVSDKTSFDLSSDYAVMAQYISYFESTDPTVRYPDWLQADIKSGEFASYYSKLIVQYKILDSRMAIVRQVGNNIAALPAINVVKVTDYDEIKRVYNMYDTMGTDQKGVLESNFYNKLIELKRRCEVLRLQDPTLGIGIMGDDLSPDAVIEVFEHVKTTETFNKAQLSLLDSLDNTKARSIVSIFKIGLSGMGSQNTTGLITITLPIPEAYYDYILFAVYRLAPDSSIMPVNGVMKNGDGKSVSFQSESLDTFVLATKANITVKDPSDNSYGTIAGIEIDATLLKYITITVSAAFAVLVLFIIIAGVRRRKFLNTYNKKHKKSLQTKGITEIPKGNLAPRVNPADEYNDRVNYNKKVKMRKKG